MKSSQQTQKYVTVIFHLLVRMPGSSTIQHRISAKQFVAPAGWWSVLATGISSGWHHDNEFLC